MPRPSSVLDGGGSRVETFGFPKLLQYGSRSRVAGESDSDSDCGIRTDRSQMLCVAETLSRFISNAKSRMKTNSPCTAVIQLSYKALPARRLEIAIIRGLNSTRCRGEIPRIRPS